MDIRQKLNIELESPFFDEALETAKAMPAVPQWLTPEFIYEFEKDYDILGQYKDAVVRAAGLVAQDADLCLLAKVLFCIVAKKQVYSKSFTALTLPEAPEGAQPEGYALLALLPILGNARLFADDLIRRGVPQDVIFDSFYFLRYRVKNHAEQNVPPYYDKAAFSMYGMHVYNNNIEVGRLRYEIHHGFDRNVKVFADGNGNVRILMCDVTLHAKGHILGVVGYTDEEGAYDANFVETEDYYEGYAVDSATGLAQNTRTRLSKKDWKLILQSGDTILKVHVRGGQKLLKEDCDISYARAKDIFQRCFPEYNFKGFVCNTWLLCPVMGRFLKKDSNIMQFQQPYHLFPAKNNAPDVFGYVYGLSVTSAADVDPETLTEDNSMQRGVKQLLKEGIYIHQFNGFIPF